MIYTAELVANWFICHCWRRANCKYKYAVWSHYQLYHFF